MIKLLSLVALIFVVLRAGAQPPPPPPGSPIEDGIWLWAVLLLGMFLLFRLIRRETR